MFILVWFLGYIGIQIMTQLNHPVVITTTTEQLSEVQTTTTSASILELKERLSKTNVMIQLRITDLTMEVASGTIVSMDEDYYYVITNDHVISSMSEAISSKVITSDGVESAFEVLARNTQLDLAYLKFPKENRLMITPIAFSNLESEIGQLVYAIGNPYGSMGAFTIGSITQYLTLSILSQEAISHSAVLARGSSGGALVNFKGELIGINTWGSSANYYAIPLRVILEFMASITL